MTMQYASPTMRRAARAWMRNFQMKNGDGDLVQITITPRGASAFDIDAISIPKPLVVDVDGVPIESPDWHVYFLVDDLIEEGIVRELDKRDRITIDGAVYMAGQVEAPANGMMKVALRDRAPV